MNLSSSTIVLVEPFADFVGGHILEKLELWVKEIKSMGCTPIVFCFNPPAKFSESVSFIRVPGFLRFLKSLIFIENYRLRWTDFCTYLMAFRFARKNSVAVLGLSASSPISIHWATGFGYPGEAWGQLVMYAGLEKTDAGISIRPQARKAWSSLLQKGCHLLCNAQLAVDTLRNSLGQNNKISFIPDPIYISTEIEKKNVREPLSLLISGQEDWRRTPLKHLTQAHIKIPIERLTLHRCQHAQDLPDFIKTVTTDDRYVMGEDLIRLFSGHKFFLLAYDPAFLSGSANLALSIAAGTPVLASNFPYALDLVQRYGKIGEVFEYGSITSFENAYEKLAGWTENQWDSFWQTRERLLADCRFDAAVRRALDTIGLEGKYHHV